jgi:hypothetical protein
MERVWNIKLNVELVRVSKTTGALSIIASFDSNRLCSGDSTSCQGSNPDREIVVPFTHTFDFNNSAYAVYGRLFRGIFNLQFEAGTLPTWPGGAAANA